ncbi:MAG: thiamine-phosphate kinase [Desulfobacteraceae bacterium]|nr:thiamine-phosphate kinase [Desulfobacteraceae bacterium]
MKISEIGGEFALIERLAAIAPGQGPEVIKGIGDDAAVLRVGPEPAPYLLVTTDILVEDQHFKRAWSTPYQIGRKAAECNVSDIAAMGGRPQWMFVSIVLPHDAQVEWVEDLYRGMGDSCQTHNILLLGGDTTQGASAAINITLIGWATPDQLCMRADAQPGDMLVVTGPLGASAAALALLNSGEKPSDYLLQKHLTPNCRLDISSQIAPLANAMIDISDGLGSEVRHICKQSQVGAQINAAAIPIHDDVRATARKLGVDPLQWALSGGEDFEILFSISPANWEELKKKQLVCYPVGMVTSHSGTIVLQSAEGKILPLPGGFDHFRE